MYQPHAVNATKAKDRSPATTDIIEKRAVRGPLESVSVTKTEDRHYWHIVIQKKLGKFIIRLFGAKNGPDFTEYNIGAAAKATVTP